MGDPRGFLTVARVKEREREPSARVQDWQEVALGLPEGQAKAQASRCMDCGIPFCHRGCPLGNLIPEFNDLVYRGELEEAARRLAETNNFPEVTGRVCPAPCESACVLAIEGVAVTIKGIERALGDHARRAGLLPSRVARATGARVAVVGSGPAGLAAAQELARRGHAVTVFEKDDRVGGLLRYGIPDFKLEKGLLDERLEQLRAEGVRFEVGARVDAGDLRRGFDRVVLALGARRPRPLSVDGASLAGVHYAMDFLTQQNRRVAGDAVVLGEPIVATGKKVVVLGGGDTGADCVGTAVRQGAESVLQLELLPRPPEARRATNPWPEWPMVFRSSTSHEEGCVRDWAVSTQALRGQAGRVEALEVTRVDAQAGRMVPVPGSAFTIPADLVVLAMGFTGPETTGLVTDLGVALDGRGNIQTTSTGRTSVPGVFAAGDACRGPSLVVWAIADGRRVARGVHASLQESAGRAPETAPAQSDAQEG